MIKPQQQLVRGYVGVTAQLYERIDRLITAHPTVKSWNDLASDLAISRPALTSSIRRSQVPLRRLKAICRTLGVDVKTLIDETLSLDENIRIP